jgi:hypothetical protein
MAAADYPAMITLRSSVAAAAASRLLVLAATGCGGSSAAPASGAPAPASVQPADVPAFHADHNARKAVTVRSCIAHPGGPWTMAGTVRNDGRSPRSYSLVVDFVKVPGNTVMQTSVLHVDSVSPGKSVAWKASGGKASQHLGCVLRYAQTS